MNDEDEVDLQTELHDDDHDVAPVDLMDDGSDTDLQINFLSHLILFLLRTSSFACFSSDFIKNVRVFWVPVVHVCVESCTGTWAN